MNRLLLASAATLALGHAAFAADIPLYDPIAPAPAAVQPATPWTGFYVGVQAGYAFSIDFDAFDEERLDEAFTPSGFEVRDNETITFDPDRTGLLGLENEEDGGFEAGAFIGADYQAGRFVFGAIADLNYIDAEFATTARVGEFVTRTFVFDGGTFTDTETVTSETNGSIGVTADIDYYATLRTRAGFSFRNLLAYAHGGLAYSRADFESSTELTRRETFTRRSEFNGVVDEFTDVRESSQANSGDGERDLFGYAVGGGVEALVGERASVKLEYQYTNLGEIKDDDLFRGRGDSFDLDFQTIRAGVAFRF